MSLVSFLFGEKRKKPEAVDVSPQIEQYISKYGKQLEDITSSPLYQRFYEEALRRMKEEEQMAISELSRQMAARGIGDTGIFLGNVKKISKSTKDALTQYGLNLEQFLTNVYLRKYLSELGLLGQSKLNYAQQKFNEELFKYQTANQGLIPSLIPVAAQITGAYLGGQAMGSALSSAISQGTPKTT